MDGEPSSFPPPMPDLGDDLLAGEEISLLRQILERLKSNRPALAITDAGVPPDLMIDFPSPGMSRLLLPRTASGARIVLKESPALTFLRGPSPTRVGGLLVNEGAKPARIFLADAESAGSGQAQGLGVITLAAEGGSWNFMVGEVLWVGSLCATAIGGETTLDIVEI